MTMDPINEENHHQSQHNRLFEDKKCNLNNSSKTTTTTTQDHHATTKISEASNNNSDIYILMNNAKYDYDYYGHTVDPTSSTVSNYTQDLVDQFKYFLLFGKIIGVLPINGLSKGKVESSYFRARSFSVLLSILIIISLTFCTIVGIVGFFKSMPINNANELAWSAHLSVFYATGLFIYIYFLRYSKEFILLLKKWKYIHLNYPTEDLKLRKDVHIVAALIMASIILENISWHFKHFFGATPRVLSPTNSSNVTTTENSNAVFNNKCGDEIEAQSALQKFYENSEPEWSLVFAYSPVCAIFVLITNKYAIYAWNFFDILIIIMSRAMSFKFKSLTIKATEYLEDPSCLTESTKWKKFMADHLVLTDLLATCDAFLAPIIFVSYWVNIYNVCIHLSLGLSPAWNSTLIGSVYAIWAFSHLTVRLYIVSIAAAKINEHAVGMCRVLKKCPIELYDKETEKFERQLFCKEIGLSGLSYFTITKSFMLRLLGVIFTVEIVLLQNLGAGNSAIHVSFGN